jgi:hypothetical protein
MENATTIDAGPEAGPVVLSYFGTGAKGTRLTLGPLTIWFSYATPIAYGLDGGPRMVRRNDWGPTTGRHIAMARDDTPKADDVDGAAFEAGLARILTRLAETA